MATGRSDDQEARSMLDLEPVDAAVIDEPRTMELAVVQPAPVPAEMTVDELAGRMEVVQDAMRRVMHESVDYGLIPGVSKPSLFKPGAEKLLVLFRLDPEYQRDDRYLPDGHYATTVTCTLYHAPTGNRLGSGMGSCATLEGRYAYRTAKRTCPVCGKPAIIKGKAEYGGGWVCWRKADDPGCGASFVEGDERITSQPEGKTPNPDLPDTYNTVLKMAAKRALVAAVLNVTGASAIFTQDVEDTAAPVSAPRPAPVVEDAEIVQHATASEIDTLRETLEILEGVKGWAEGEVVDAARKSFRRPGIKTLADLTSGEVAQIQKAATAAVGP